MTKLSSTVDIAKLTEFIKNQQKIEISDFVYERFNERYLYPINQLKPEYKHGFSIMAISCIMIEAFQSFKSGYEDTVGISRETFSKFLSSEPEFSNLKGLEDDFYFNVRCGILHQSETTNGWKIIRVGKIFDKKNKTINATKFIKALEISLQKYTLELKYDNWNSENWKNLIKKLNHIIKNCK